VENMNYKFEINSENRTIHVITMGDLITKEVAAMGLEIMMKAKELKYNIVYDHRQSKNKISIGEAYYWFSTHYDCIDKKLRFIPTAYIANKGDWDFYSFFECSCVNKGIPLRVFQEESSAIKWLESLYNSPLIND
jgi:hypothetical protein